MRRADFECAVQKYTEALKLDPENKTIRLNLKVDGARRQNKIGLNYYKQGNWEMAVKYFREARDLDYQKVYEKNLRLAEENLKVVQEEQLQKKREEETRLKASQSFELLFSKGDTPSTPVDLTFLDPNKPAATKVISFPPEKGLKINEVPKPTGPVPDWDPYSVKTRAEIIFEAFRLEDRNWNRSIQHLQNYLDTNNPHNVKVKGAISYLEGLRLYEIRHFPKPQRDKKRLFDPPNSEDSQRLLGTLDFGLAWSGPKNPLPEDRLANPLDWREERRKTAALALKTGKGDWKKAIRYLEKRLAEDEMDIEARNAFHFLQGYYGYHQFAKDQKVTRKGNGQ